MKTMIPAPEGEREGGLCSPGGAAGLGGTGEGVGGGEAKGELRPRAGVWALLWRKWTPKGS